MPDKKPITRKCIRSELEELVIISGGNKKRLSRSSIADTLDYLKVLLVYRRFDIEATKRELRNGKT